MTEATRVNPVGRITPRCVGMYSDANEAAMKRVIDFGRKYGVAAQGLKLGHAGRKASTQPQALGGKPLRPEEGAWQTVVPFGPDWHVPRARAKAAMDTTRSDFVSAVGRALRIGYDLVEPHGVHGYLLHQFLSPISKQRHDEYGGSLENRLRQGHLALSCAGTAGREQVLSARHRDHPSRP